MDGTRGGEGGVGIRESLGECVLNLPLQCAPHATTIPRLHLFHVLHCTTQQDYPSQRSQSPLTYYYIIQYSSSYPFLRFYIYCTCIIFIFARPYPSDGWSFSFFIGLYALLDVFSQLLSTIRYILISYITSTFFVHLTHHSHQITNIFCPFFSISTFNVNVDPH